MRLKRSDILLEESVKDQYDIASERLYDHLNDDIWEKNWISLGSKVTNRVYNFAHLLVEISVAHKCNYIQ